MRAAAPKSLQELYDQRQETLQTDEVKLGQLDARAATAQKWAIGGMTTLFAGQALAVVNLAAKNAVVLGTGLGLTVAGLAAFCPALWVRDSAQLDASLVRIERDVLKDAQAKLAEELKK